MALPLALTSQITVGVSFVLACRRHAVATPLSRNVAFAALMIFLGMLVVPASAYVLWLFPAWSLMYWIDPASLPVAPWLLAVVHVPVALGAFIAARAWLQRGQLRAPWALSVGAALGFAGGIAVSLQRLSGVGTMAAFHRHAGALQPFSGSAAGYLTAVALPVQVLAWVFTLWRLYLLDRASQDPSVPGEQGGQSVPQISAELLSVAPSAAGTRKSS